MEKVSDNWTPHSMGIGIYESLEEAGVWVEWLCLVLVCGFSLVLADVVGSANLGWFSRGRLGRCLRIRHIGR